MTEDVIIIGAGQAGLATAYHLQKAGLRFAVLEAGVQATGTWLRHYDSLKLFSPARHASLPGLAFPGHPDHYPMRDEVAAYLASYARHFQFPILPGTSVTQVLPTGQNFRVLTEEGMTLTARTVVAATGTYGTPVIPLLPGQSTYQGQVLHSVHYRQPEPFAGQRVVVVGAGNSAVQIAVELAQVAQVTLAVRHPVAFFPQRPLGRDVHDWISWLKVDQLPLGALGRLPSPRTVFDHGAYQRAVRSGNPRQRSMFLRWTPTGVEWSDGQRESVDCVLFATGYRPKLTYLRGTGALNAADQPIQRLGRSLTVRGLYFAGLSGQRALASATLRGAGKDAEVVLAYIRRHLKWSGRTD
ncbi:flavin-containing monooxygenase [Deinococcus oregonensis]|uniref:Flavin-containing monooxygenase n=1 Tax=Deinococcus oregonensis TaxID=1805970 RepID=A0ABV6ATH4_9DEIO